MAAEHTGALGGLRNLMDAGADRFGELALLAGFALIRAWNRYTDRRDTKRGGRRASDAGLAGVQRSIARIDRTMAELTTAHTRLAARVRTLEGHAKEGKT